MANSYLEYAATGSDSNRKTWTFSAWVKRTSLGSTDMNIFSGGENVSEEAQLKFPSDNTLSFFNDYATSGRVSGTTSRLFRDTNAWYHIVWKHDVTNATAADRWKIYINGVRLDPSDYGSPSIPNEDGVYNKTSSRDMWVGARAKAQSDSSYQYFNGLMAHVHFCDGYAYDASSFGEFDTDTGVWKPITAPSVSYGTNGFFIKFDNSGALGTDSSGNGNNLTVNGNMKQTISTPTNNFCSWNYYFGAGNQTAINAIGGLGGTQFSSGSTSNETFVVGNLAFSQGKYYWEWKAISEHPEANFWGVCNIDGAHIGNGSIDTQGNSNFWGMNQGTKYNGGSGGSYGSQIDINNIGMCAVDMDNGKIWLGENGTWFNSGDPAAGTNAMYTNLSGYLIAPFHADTYSTYTPSAYYNFGTGYFGTTAVSSAQNPSDGIGIFEYTVPTGFKALCTKSLNAQEYS